MAANTYSADLESSSSQYFSIADGSQTGLDFSSAFTLEFWVKLESQPAVRYTLVGKSSDVSEGRSYRINYRVSGSDGYIRIILSANGNSNNDGSEDSSEYQYTLDNGTWYHIAAVYDGSNTQVELYVNGVSQGTKGSNPATIKNSSTAFTFGADFDTSGNPTNFFDGLIDDVRAWSDVRTSTEISDNYQTELVGNEEGLVGYWKLENNALDETTNNNDLTNNNSVTYSTDVPFGGTSCTYSGSGDWYINSSDNCVISTDTYVNGNVHLLNTGSGLLYIIDGATLACENINSTSTDIDVEAGSHIKLWNDS